MRHSTLLNDFGPTAITCLLIGGLSAQVGGGLLASLACVPLLVWILWCIATIATNSIRRRSLAIKLCLWLVCIGVVAGVQEVRWDNSRHLAQAVAVRIEAYRARNGQYPIHLSDVGIDRNAPDMRGIRLGYGRMEDGPFLYYFSTFNPFDEYIYDFKQRDWTYFNDD